MNPTYFRGVLFDDGTFLSVNSDAENLLVETFDEHGEQTGLLALNLDTLAVLARLQGVSND